MPCSDDSTPLPQERADRGQRKTAAQCAAVRRSAGAVRAPATSLETVLREDDLDAAVLRLAHAIGGRNALVVLAAAADDHGLTGHARLRQGVCDVVGAPLGEPLVVASRTRSVGIAGDLDRHVATSTPRIGSLSDDRPA